MCETKNKDNIELIEYETHNCPESPELYTMIMRFNTAKTILAFFLEGTVWFQAIATNCTNDNSVRIRH